MREIDRTKDLKRFYLDWQALNHVYEQYARDNGLTYVSLFMLQLIDDGTTQKELCDTLYFPKQTINKTIQSFCRKGYIVLKNNNVDKRYKLIYLTEKGKDFQDKVIPAIQKAETESFDSLSEEEQKTLADLWEKYTSICIRKINGD
ncbi:MAG TPA: MarR family winged helix-turn-helix transcriptional regulator [Candidatus Mediterraneibacter pullicola]|uniref:MarR family winged helix-turn-helix transcriptional regulator n=1 Tax=Candidatus Mediterraneibacter pullicola TaxID=2838682 RepID=A0A9D2HBI9_9FIRM|nr:MarR family winged helix-turn-helix transcriptional regulator [Candidatus Mediterraneibacter pullicola]